MGMWIEQIFVESFGAYRKVLIEKISPGLSIVVGRNEAGKSTLLEFVRSMFFGFKTRSSRANTYESPHGLPRKGWLTVHMGNDAVFRVERAERRGLKEGMLTISDEHGNLVDMAAIPVLRAGMDRSSYESLFAFDLDQMRHLDRESLRRKILAATVGSLEVNPLDVRRKLEDRIKALGKRSVRDPESILAIQSAIRELEEKIDAIADRPARYWDLKESLSSLEKTKREIATEIGSTEVALLRLNGIMRYEDSWKRLRAVESEMVGVEKARDFPADGVSRLEEVLRRRREASETVLELEKVLEQVREDLKTLQPDQVLLDHGEFIQAINREALRLTHRPSEISAARTALERSRADLTDSIGQLGGAWSWERVAAWEPQSELEGEIRFYTSGWIESRDKVRGLETSVSESSEALKRIEARIARKNEELETIRPSCEGFLTPDSRQKIQEWKEINGRIPDLEDRLREQKRRMQGLIAARQDLEKRLEHLEHEGPLPVAPALFWALVLLFASAGIGMVIAGLRSDDVSYYVFPAIGIAIVLALSWLVRWKIIAERRYLSGAVQSKEALLKSKTDAVMELAEVENDRRRLVGDLESMRRRSGEISLEVLGDSNAGFDTVRIAEARSGVAEEFVHKAHSLEENIRADQADLEAEKARYEQINNLLVAAQSEFAVLRENWLSFLRDHSLDETLDPQAGGELLGRLREVKTNFRRLSEQENAIKAMTGEWEKFTGRVLELGHEMNRPVSPDMSPVEQAERWQESVTDAKEVVSRQKVLLARVNDSEIRLSLELQKMRDADHELDALMEAARVHDEESFRVMAKGHERYRSLAQDRDVLVSSILAGLNYEDESAMRSDMSNQDWEENRAKQLTLDGRLEALKQESDQLAAQGGRLQREIETLETEQETERLLAEKEELLARLNDGIKQWVTVKFATGLLEKTLRIFESEKQPRVLERGSQIFREITGKRYSRILLPLDSERVKVDRDDGVRIEEDHLSRGTLEQLYLSLRLAHMDVYRRDDAIPLMMDDVVVNFDPERAQRTAHALAKFAQESEVQVIFFTCHPHVAAMFPDTVSRITLNSE
jgi:uncharacterized protein YhaN